MPIAQIGYTFNGKEAEGVILTPIVESTKLEQLHTIIPGIKADMKVTYLGDLDKITKLDLGCGTGKETKTIPSSQKTWSPAELKIWLTECYDDMKETLWVWGTKNGIDRKDLTDTDYLDLVVQLVERAMPRDAFRIAWFSSKDAANFSGGGRIKNGVSVTDYNQLDGFFEKIIALTTTNPDHRVTIPENSAASAAAQLNLAADRAVQVYTDLLENPGIDPRLTGDENRFILSTSSLYNNYKKYLRSFPNIEASYARILGKYETLTIDGDTIVNVSDWDRIIRADFTNGTIYDLPHRAVLATPDMLQIGVDASEKLNELKVWYNEETELNHIKGGYRMDTQIPFDYGVAAAY